MGLSKEHAEEEAFKRSGNSERIKQHVRESQNTRKNPNYKSPLYRNDPDGPRDENEFLPGCGCSECYWHWHYVQKLMNPPKYGLSESFAEPR